MKQKASIVWFGSLVFIAIEQAIKLVIFNFHFDKTVPIIPPYIYFSPMFNRDYSWYNSMLQLGVSKLIHIAITSVIIILIVMMFVFYTKRYNKIKLLNWGFTFLFAGSLCSWIDKVFWNGSLDYIELSGFFTFDLKDLYLNIAIGFIIALIIFKHKQFNDFDEKKFLKELIGFYKKKS